jgi:carboxymethylenebutenolidase
MSTPPELAAIAVGRRTVDVEIYRPEGKGPWPGILLLHELFGLTSQVRADARHLAREGYLVFAPDLYTDGMRRYCIKYLFSAEALANKGEGPSVGEIHRLLDVLKAHADCNGKLGMIGMCLTGGFVLQMARRDDMVAPVVFHHSFGVRGSGIAPADAAEIKHTVQGHFAAGDRLCPKARVEALGRQLGNKLEAYTYEGVGHGLRSQFRHSEQSAEAWQRTLGFFQEHLQS